MTKPPLSFRLIAAVALLWNLIGLGAVVADLRLSAADIAALPAAEQALYAARPLWSVAASVVAVVGGSAGCVALLIGSRWAVPLFWASVAGVVLQDIGLFAVAGAGRAPELVPVMLQGLVFVIAVALVGFARRGVGKGWLS
jgi:hypothetical protein